MFDRGRVTSLWYYYSVHPCLVEDPRLRAYIHLVIGVIGRYCV